MSRTASRYRPREAAPFAVQQCAVTATSLDAKLTEALLNGPDACACGRATDADDKRRAEEIAAAMLPETINLSAMIDAGQGQLAGAAEIRRREEVARDAFTWIRGGHL